MIFKDLISMLALFIFDILYVMNYILICSTESYWITELGIQSSTEREICEILQCFCNIWRRTHCQGNCLIFKKCFIWYRNRVFYLFIFILYEAREGEIAIPTKGARNQAKLNIRRLMVTKFRHSNFNYF